MYPHRASKTHMVVATAIIALAWFGRLNIGKPAAAQAEANQLTLTALADAWIDEVTAGTNYGSAPSLHVGQYLDPSTGLLYIRWTLILSPVRWTATTADRGHPDCRQSSSLTSDDQALIAMHYSFYISQILGGVL